MAAKGILVFCASALLIQTAYSACLGGIGAPYGFAGTGWGYNGLAAPFAYEGAGLGYGCGGVASTGGGLPCASASPIPPVGVSVLSENVYEGALAVGGNLPFMGTVAVEGVLPTAGAGAVSYGCGNGAVGIDAEDGVIATGIAPHVPAPYGAYGAGMAAGPYNGIGGLGFGFGAGCGAGYGRGGFY